MQERGEPESVSLGLDLADASSDSNNDLVFPVIVLTDLEDDVIFVQAGAVVGDHRFDFKNHD